MPLDPPPPPLEVCDSCTQHYCCGTNSAGPNAEVLHPVLPNATENPENQSSKGLFHWNDLDQDQ